MRSTGESRCGPTTDALPYTGPAPPAAPGRDDGDAAPSTTACETRAREETFSRPPCCCCCCCCCGRCCSGWSENARPELNEARLTRSTGRSTPTWPCPCACPSSSGAAPDARRSCDLGKDSTAGAAGAGTGRLNCTLAASALDEELGHGAPPPLYANRCRAQPASPAGAPPP